MIIINHVGESVELTQKVFDEHISPGHPEVTIEIISEVLSRPDQVWISQSKPNVELYYQRKLNTEKARYWMVVVKKLENGNFVSTASTKSTVVGSKLIYQK